MSSLVVFRLPCRQCGHLVHVETNSLPAETVVFCPTCGLGHGSWSELRGATPSQLQQASPAAQVFGRLLLDDLFNGKSRRIAGQTEEA